MHAIIAHRRGQPGRPTIVMLLALLLLVGSIVPALAAAPAGTAAPAADVSDPPEAEPTDPPTALPVPTDPGAIALPTPGPGTGDDIELPPPPRTSLTLTPVCRPAGFDFELTIPTLPGEVKILQWRPAEGPITSLSTPGTGTVESGEGQFQARGLALDSGGGTPSAITAWLPVTVECERPHLTIEAHPACDPDGLAYDIAVDHEPDGPVAYKAQWREIAGGVHTVDGRSGHLPTGEGIFEIRGVLHEEGPGMHVSEWMRVAVHCPDRPVHPVDPGIEIRPGVPTFTG